MSGWAEKWRRTLACVLIVAMGTGMAACGSHYQSSYTGTGEYPRLDLTQIGVGDEIEVQLVDGEIRRGIVQGVTPYAVQINDYWYEIEYIADLVVYGRPDGRGGVLAAALAVTIVVGLVGIFLIGAATSAAGGVGR